MKHLIILLLALGARADFQFNVMLGELDDVTCWDPLTCAPSAATVHLTSVLDPQEQYELSCWILGPGGDPLAYSFGVEIEEPEFCDLVIDGLWARFEGPCFRYEVSWVVAIDPCEPGFPVDMPVPAGDGCLEDVGEGDWTWANHPDGCVTLCEDYTNVAGTTLLVEAGMQVEAMAGVHISIEGELEATGTADSMITFTGEGWDGLVFAEVCDADLYHCRITGVDSPDDGGAITVENGGVARLFHCLVDHNSTAGAGGAAFVADGGVLSVYASTVSHNTGGTSGGVHLGGSNALLECGMCLMTFPQPPYTHVTGEGFTNVFFTDFWPVPPPWPPLPNECDPGYVDPDSGDFHISYWDLVDPTVVNCIIDVSVNVLENDPDGTPGDIGAFPFDQHAILHPVSELAVADRPGDEGGYVLLSFHASPNDGSVINPVTLYSIWERLPGAGPDEWNSAGAVAAMGDDELVYTVQVPTLDDQFEGNENLHAFRVGTHSTVFPQPSFAPEITGFSVDNLAPLAVTGLQDGGWYWDTLPPVHDLIDIWWDPNPANDLSHYEMWLSLSNNFESASLHYTGVETMVTLSYDHGLGMPDTPLYIWVRAIDNHLNASQPAEIVLIPPAVDGREAGTFALQPNVPNPFNPTTRVCYELAAPGHVRLEVFNIAGERVAVLVDGPQAAGAHQAVFDAGGLASGVYFCRLATPEFSQTRKMVLAR